MGIIFLLTHSLTHSFIHSLIHSLTHSLTYQVPIAVPITKWILWPPPFGLYLGSLGPLGLFPLFFKFYDALCGFSCPPSHIMTPSRAKRKFPQLDNVSALPCYSLTHSLTHSLTLSLSLTHSLTHSLSHSLIDLLTHSLTYLLTLTYSLGHNKVLFHILRRNARRCAH